MHTPMGYSPHIRVGAGGVEAKAVPEKGARNETILKVHKDIMYSNQTKKHKMKTTFLSLKTASVMLAITGFTLGLQAVPTTISGTISMSGTVTMDGTSFLAATRFTGFQNVFVGGGLAVSGDYAGTSGAAVTLTPFIWSPPTASTPIVPLWTFVSGGNTYSFDLNVLHMDFASTTGLLLSGTGTAHITGPGLQKLATEGHWDFSAQTLGQSTFTYSSSSIVPTPSGVPDGGTTVSLLGAVMLGLGLVGRKHIL